MTHSLLPTVILLLASLLPAQEAGLRGGVQEPPLVQRLQPPDDRAAERVITVEAVAEVRVAPAELRVVFAVSAGGTSAAETNAAGSKVLAAARARLQAAGVAADAIDVDRIAMVPVYSWGMQKQNDRDVLAESRVGFRVQHNLHVRVADEATATAVSAAAQEVEGVEVLAVDYWSDQLAQRQQEAQEKALAAAQRKAKLLLSVFASPPVPINVHESTRVLFPHQLYHTLPRVEDSVGGYYSENVPRVPATRPLHVYFRGLFADVDAPETAMPGKREIHVVSTVRLYYEAPDRPRPEPK